MTISEDNFLDLANLLINEIVGSPILFIVVGLALINYYFVKNNFPVQVNLFGSILFIGLVTSYIYNAFLWMIILFVVSVIVYSLFPKVFKR